MTHTCGGARFYLRHRYCAVLRHSVGDNFHVCLEEPVEYGFNMAMVRFQIGLPSVVWLPGTRGEPDA